MAKTWYGLMALLGLFSTPVARAWGPPVVAVAASATDEYVAHRSTADSPRRESYVFYQGKCFKGTTDDGSLDKFTFPSITQFLGKQLTKQNYFPAPSLKEADLLIVVNWGVTTVHDDLELNRAAKTGEAVSADNAANSSGQSADHAALNMLLADNDMEQQNMDQSINFNARLLGYKGLPKNPSIFPSEEDEYELSEERYFIILMAYDTHKLKKGVRPVPVWSTRLSMASPGHNFTEAVPALSIAASDYFGKNSEGLKHAEVQKGKATVTIGETKSLGEVK